MIETKINKNNKEKTCILILNYYKSVYLMNSHSFKYVKNVTFKKKIAQDYIGSLIICDNLQIKSIKNIYKRELLGKTFWSKFYSFILGRYSIEIEYESNGQISFMELKRIVIDSLIENMNISLNIYLFGIKRLKQDTDFLINKIEKAKSYKEIIYALGYEEKI